MVNKLIASFRMRDMNGDLNVSAIIDYLGLYMINDDIAFYLEELQKVDEKYKKDNNNG